jgi:hypothetical protein
MKIAVIQFTSPLAACRRFNASSCIRSPQVRLDPAYLN